MSSVACTSEVSCFAVGVQLKGDVAYLGFIERWNGTTWSQVTVQESERNIVKPDEEHVIWPFDGEYWRDELGFYRQTITSKCGR